MSLNIRRLAQASKKPLISREQMLALVPEKEYNDGRTKQCHRDECDIVKIMNRFEVSGTISHLSKFEGVYADFSDFNFHEHTTKLAQGQEVFDALTAEVRREFGQSPQAFFDYVNDPKNRDDLWKKLPALAKPGDQLPRKASPDADLEAAKAAASKTAPPAHSEPLAKAPDGPPAVKTAE